MKLHSLDISGFKSFVDPVSLKFAGGVTSIVGPNGCGKSNLVDAITWVLGEQSAKFLRGAKMEDVIFNGSSKRKPLGMADVSLTLQADPSIAEAVDGKITIGRRVFRTGASQYRLNGKVVRLKQIKDLLMDTGLGIRAYSVIEQGRIGMILSGKPQERRKLLEEAAGITRYKARKRIAEIKLEEATANLLRLDDIISEVKRSLRSLKRQANAARRYQGRERDYHELLKKVLLGRWALVREDLNGLDQRLEDLTGRDAELTAALHGEEAALAEDRESLDRLASELAEKHEEQAQLAATIEGRQEFLKGARQRSDEAVERLQTGRSKADERRRQTSDYRHSLGTLDERTQQLLEERDAAARLVAEDDEEIAACQRRVEGAAAGLENLGEAFDAASVELEETRSELQQAQVEIERRTYRRRFLGEEGSRLDRQLAEAESTLRGARGKVDEIGLRLSEHAEQHGEAKQELEELLRRESETSDASRRFEARLAGLEQRRRILVELSEEHAERRRALVESLGEIGIEGARFLADQASPPAGYEEVIDRYLSDLADAVVLGAEDDALDLARRLAELGGSAVFLRPLSGAPGPALEDETDLTPLAAALGLPEELAGALPPAYLVGSPASGGTAPSSAEAARLAAAHPGVAFISRDRLWAQGGAVHVHGADAAPGVLARASELASVNVEIPECRERLEAARAELEDLASRRTAKAGQVHRLDQQIAELQREAAVAQARRQDAAARHEKLDAERRTLVEEDGQLVLELGTLEGDSGELEKRLSAAERDVERLRGEVAEAQAAAEAAKDEREALRTAGAGRRGRLELLEERLESHNQEAARVQSQITYTEEQLSVWSREDDALQRRLRDLETAMEEADGQLQAALERRAESQDAVLEQQQRLDDRREQIRGLEERIQELRAGHEELRTEIEGLRVARAGAQQDAEHLSVAYRDAFKLALPGRLGHKLEPAAEDDADSEAVSEESGDETPGEAVAADLEDVEPSDEPTEAFADADADADAGEVPEADAPVEWVEDDVEIPASDRAALAEHEADLARCKADLERLGPVNVLAAKEYDEQFERDEFLTAQRRDVADSVRRLQATIAEINEISSERFRETFDEVNARFGETFTRLFRGGEAEMRLFDEEDLLDTGIEIVARPPGKRAQNIMLLSGGEKALTAIALLFALFQTRASPFCILDEVDAPLDDVNILRFVETLKEMAVETQFLIVTHNKLTMEVASTLYGVTMEERGVSKLVAVEMEQVQPAIERPAATA